VISLVRSLGRAEIKDERTVDEAGDNVSGGGLNIFTSSATALGRLPTFGKGRKRTSASMLLS